MSNDAEQKQIVHCSSCGCKMDVSAVAPYTNVVCPHCEHHTRVKCELDQYLLTGRHAAGGMSMVFTARDITLEREVAIKVLNEEYSRDEVRMQQFEQEALITAAISHPHVVRVFTVGQAYGHFYIAMEMVTGENLEQKISREGALSEDVVLPMVAEMIAGLSEANRAGLIHRDIKPGNILFDAMGHVKIVDFGLALVTQGGKAKADEIWATPYYVPPEALDGLEEDFRSDIYAMGATIYHVLSGHPPIKAESNSTRDVRKAKESVAPLEQVAPWLKPETCQLVNKAMALSPADRFSSYDEMEEAWERAFRAMQGTGVSEPIHGRERAQKRVKKQGLGGLIVSIVIAVLLVGGAITMFLNKGDVDHSVPDDNGTIVEQDDQESGYDPETAARIARVFANSHVSLKKKEYDEARDYFFQLMNDREVEEPAASWAGIEAVVATWLEGNPGDASATLRKVNDHIRTSGLEAASPVVKLSNRLAEPGLIDAAGVGNDSMAVVHLMAAALKNWEIGAWDKAVSLFDRVSKHPLPEGSPLMVYREISARYLDDYQHLKPYRNATLPHDIEGCRARLADLNQVMGSLQTRGRARFHIRIWQLRLHRAIKRLRNDAAERGDENQQAPKYRDVLKGFHQLVAEAKYAEASELLQDVTMQGYEEVERDSWVYLADSASAFLGTLEGVIPAGGVTIDVQSVEGKKYSRIVAAKSSGLELQNDSGKEFVPWAKIKPDSVLVLHQKAFRQTVSTLEGQLRTEQAICYAWLAGMKDKAKQAARKLADTSPSFDKRWTATMRAQHDTP